MDKRLRQRRVLASHAAPTVARFLAASLLLWLLGVCSAPVQAACKTPLPAQSLRALDDQVDADPAGTIHEAQRQLAAALQPDTFVAAQLDAIVADAFDTLDDDNQAAAAILAGRERLRGLPENESVRSVQLRLSLVAADAAEARADLLRATDELTGLEQSLPDGSLGHACLLLVRSRLNARLNRHDEAVKDGINAYRIATGIRNPSAAADAAYQLAMAYRRAGLFEDGKQMAQEAIDYNRRTGQRAALANALFIKAQILGDLRDFESALTTSAEARQLSIASGEPIGVAFVDQERCNELLSLNRLSEAEQACESAARGWTAAGRTDQQPATEDNLARIDMLRGRYGPALNRLNRVLGTDVRSVAPSFLPRLYHDRSVALTHLGRYRDALRDASQWMRLTDVADAEQRSLAAGAMQARLRSEKVEEEKRALQVRLLLEEQQTTSQRRQKLLSLGLAAVAGILVLLMAHIMRSRSRHERAMRRARETVETHARVIASIREGVLLIDDRQRIEYANPSLLGLLGRPNETVIGMPLENLGISWDQLAGAAGTMVGGLPAGASELYLVTGSGKPLIVLITTSRLVLHERTLQVCILQDVTRLRRLERMVHASASSERDRLSNQVHEGLAQDLAGVALLLKGIRGARPADVETIQFLLGYIYQTTERARAVARGLSPVQVMGGSLEAAISQLAVDMSANPVPLVTFRSHVQPLELTPTQAAHLYEIVRECLNNAVHGLKCREVNVDLRVVKDKLVLTSIGAGGGSTDHTELNKFGLEKIAYLARVIGGAARFTQHAKSSSHFTVTVPLAHLAHAEEVEAGDLGSW